MGTRSSRPAGKDDTFLAGPVRRMPIIPLLAECPCGFLLKTTVTAALSLSLSLADESS